MTNPGKGSAAFSDVKTAVRFLTDHHMMFGIHKDKVAIVGGGNGGVLAAMYALGHEENDSVISTYVVQGKSPFSPEVTRPLGDSITNLRRILGTYFSQTKGISNGTNISFEWIKHTHLYL